MKLWIVTSIEEILCIEDKKLNKKNLFYLILINIKINEVEEVNKVIPLRLPLKQVTTRRKIINLILDWMLAVYRILLNNQNQKN